MGTANGSARPAISAIAPFTRVGSWMLPGALRRLRESLVIFARTPSTPSMLSGRDSAALRNGTVMNGGNVSQIMQMVASPRVNGLRTISSGAVGGSGSFHCRAAMSAPASFMTIASSSSRKDLVSANDCTRTFSAIRWAAKFSGLHA